MKLGGGGAELSITFAPTITIINNNGLQYQP